MLFKKKNWDWRFEVILIIISDSLLCEDKKVRIIKRYIIKESKTKWCTLLEKRIRYLKY